MISQTSKRIQLTFNSKKEKEKVIIDYLSNSFNENNEIKRILYEHITNQSGKKRVKRNKSKGKALTNSNLKSKLLKSDDSESKIIKDNKSEERLLTITESKQQTVKKSNNDSKLLKDTVKDDFTLDSSSFNNKSVEVKKENIQTDDKAELIRANELEQLKEFM